MTQRRIYQCVFPYFVTFNVLHREWIFDDEEKAEMLHEIILNAGKMKNHMVYQFCIMPDHVHVLCRTKHLQQERVSVPATKCCKCFGIHSASTETCAVNNGKNMHNISDFMYTLKSYFTYQMRKQFGIEYKFLQTRYNFRIINKHTYLQRVISYIKTNPDKAGLPKKWNQYPYQYKNDNLINKII